MSNVNVRTFPIALGLGGILIIIVAIYANGFGNLPDNSMWLLVIIGLLIILAGYSSYIWERNMFYQDREKNRKFPEHIKRLGLLPSTFKG